MRQSRWIALILALALVAAACGGDDSDGEGVGDEASAEDTTVEDTPAGDTTAETGDGSDEPTASATGVTEDGIKLGFAYADLEALAEQGFVDLDHGPYEDLMQVLVDDLNANGGIDGRQVEVVYGGFLPVDTEEQLALCTRFTEDEEVFAVLGGLDGDSMLCVTEQHETIAVGGTLTDELLERSVAPWVTANASVERTAAALVELLDREGELDGRTIAVHGSAGADSKVASDVVAPTLEAAGYEVTYESVVDAPQNDPQASSELVAINIEKMKEEGVDTVIAVGRSIPVADFAEAGFFPHVYTTEIGPTRALALGGQVDLGAFPTFATVGSDGPEVHAQNPALQECIRIWEDATGEEILSLDEELAQGESSGRVGLRISCNVLRLFAAVAEAAGTDLNNESFLAGAESLGEITLPAAEQASFGPGKYDGQDAFTIFRWDTSVESDDKFVADGDPEVLDG